MIDTRPLWHCHALSLSRYRIALAKPISLASASGRHQLTARQGLLLTATRNGHQWRSECAPLPLFSKETFGQVKSALVSPASLRANWAKMPPSVVFAVESLALQMSAPLTYQPVNVAGFQGGEHEVIKVKCGQLPFERDMVRLNALVEQGKRLRIDCNQQWRHDQLQACYQRFGAAIDYFEEPLTPAASHHYPTLKLPFALDEQLRQRQLPDYAYRAKAWVIKPMLTGLSHTLELADIAQARGIQVILSSALETYVAIEFYHALAHFLKLDQPQGLDTLGLYKQQAFGEHSPLPEVKIW